MRVRRNNKREKESTKAVEDATNHLLEVKSRHPEVQAVSDSLRKHRERNHFAEQLQIIMGGHV